MPIEITHWAIRHKPTGFYLPQPKGRMGRGGSFVEPTATVQGLIATYPRTFVTQRGATNALSQWLRGHHHGVREYEDGYWYDAGSEVKHVASRVREDMEVVEIQLVLP